MPLVSKAFGDIITFTRASTGSYFDSAGVLQSAAINAPRLDYNPSTLAAQGLLIEEQRTNLLTYSEQFNDGTWPLAAGTVTANATTAPSGATTADTGVTNGTNFQISQGTTITSGATLTGSVFFKPNGINEVEIILLSNNNTTPYGRATFNVSTGVISVAASTANGGTNASAAITAINNGWYRCSVTVTYPAVTLGGMRINAAGATGGIYLWGAQFEAGAFPTSYIPTTTAAVTRSADVASVNTLSPWYNATSGTLYAEFLPGNLSANGIAVEVGDGGLNNRFNIELQPGTSLRTWSRVSVAGVLQIDIPINNTLSLTVPTKSALAVEANNTNLAANGTAGTTDTSCAVPTVNKMQIGNVNTGSGSALNGWVRRLTYYPRRLTNAELQTITA